MRFGAVIDPPARRHPLRLPAILGALLSCISVSCASRTHITYDSGAATSPAATTGSAAPDVAFDSDRLPAEVVERLLDTGTHYEVRQLSFGSVGDNGQPGNQVTVDYHRSRHPGRHPVVIVLPIWGRYVYPSNAVTRTLRKRSDGEIHILNVLGSGFLIDWPAQAVETDEQAFIDRWAEGAEREMATMVDVRRLLDWAELQPEIDGNRIGLIGFSHGAIFAPTLAARDGRFDAIVLVMGGAHPHEVIARCNGGKTGLAQQRAKEAFGWSQDEMADLLRPLYAPIDPVNYPDRVDPARVLIFESGRDQCIPESAREALWQVMGRPERYIIDATHRRAFLTMTPVNFNWMRKRIWDFFEKHLLDAAGG